MSLVTDRLNASKPPPDPKKNNNAINNNKDLEVDVKKEEPSFFGSFFSAAKNAPKKKGVAVMESVSSQSRLQSEQASDPLILAPAYHPPPSCAE